MSKYTRLAVAALPYVHRTLWEMYKYGSKNTTEPTTSTQMVKRKTLSSKKSSKKKAISKTKKKYRARTYRTYAKRKTNLRKEITAIKRTLRSDQARHTYRRRDTSAIKLSSVGTCVRTAFAYTRITELETAMTNLRYYDPSAPTTLATASGASGTYTRQIHFESIYSRLRVRNNYQIPCKVTVYSCVPKTDTSTDPTSFFSAGITDQTVSGLTAASPLINLFDIDMVKDNWSCAKATSMELLPGREMVCSWAGKAFDYDPSNADTHSLSYQKKYRAHTWVVQVHGIIGHDNTALEYATLLAGVDLLCDRKFVITYDAGVNLNDFSADDNSSLSFTNGPVVSQVVVDNQNYSIA